jgi:Concanavalin A-like lectin/glucanases superfamily
VQLDGIGAAAEVPPAPQLNLVADWTFELWFKDEDPNGFLHDYRYLLNKGDGQSAESPYYLLLGNGNLLAGIRANGQNYPLTFSLQGAGYSPKLWQHVAATFRASTNTLTLYLNGRWVAQQVEPRHAVQGNDLPLQIGRLGPTLGRYWLGKIDDVRVWSSVRSASEIETSYRTELATVPPALVGNWRFDDGVSPGTADSATPPHPATLRGAATFSTQTPPAP